MADDTDQRIRLVVLGGGGVGKTAIIKRFLFNTFEEKYRSTVEDLYYREYDIGSVTIKVDILDTAGDLQFPAMRRLSIATAGAFLLVYSLTCPASFDILKQCFQEIRDNRSDFDRVPIVVVGNKAEVDERHKQIAKEEVTEWVYCELPRIRAKILECSARTGAGVTDVFRAFLQLAKITATFESDSGGLRRRSSAYGSLHADNRVADVAAAAARQRRDSVAGTATTSDHSEVGTSKFKPRSRSLIRRSSRKTAKLRNSAADATPAHEECTVS